MNPRALAGAMLLMACGPRPPADAPVAPTAPVATPTAEIVRVEDGSFMADGRRHVVIGANFWPAMNLAMSGTGGDRDRLLRELDRLSSLGINNIRIIAGSEGPNDAPYRVTPALQPGPGEYDERLLDGLDFLLEACTARDIRVVMVLTNFWEWSGGMAQYVTWAMGDPIPYPADHPWTEFTAHARRFYGCQPCQESFRAHVEKIVTRVNGRTGLAYRDDPTIFAWQLANEPRYYPATWIDETAAFIDALDSRHMITTGSEGEIGGPFAPTHDGPHIDYATAHLWPQNWDWYDPAHPETMDEALGKARAYIEEHVQGAAALGKPLVLEEYGLARDANAGDPYDPAATTVHRDRFYDLILGMVEASVANGGALQGQAFWAWAGEARPGHGLVGDPPHEKPGWYSVYDTDHSTLDRLRAHARQVIPARE